MITPSNGPFSAEWEALVGKAIIRFGDIELALSKCLALIPQDALGNGVLRMEFTRRADLLIAILEGRSERGPHLDEILRCVKTAQGFAKTRNLIAHNPVMLDIYALGEENEDGELEHFAEHTIRSARDSGPHLTLESLKEFAASVEGLAAQFWMALLKFAGTSEHLWRVHASKKPQ